MRAGKQREIDRISCEQIQGKGDWKMIQVPLVVFNQLVRDSEKIRAVERYVNRDSKYICTDDVLAILGIEKKQKTETK